MKTDRTYLFSSFLPQLDGKRSRAVLKYLLSFSSHCEHCVGDDPHNITSRRECSAGHDSHDPIGPTPVDKLPFGGSQCFPERYSAE